MGLTSAEGGTAALRLLRRERLWRLWLVPVAFATVVAVRFSPGWYFFDSEVYWKTAETLVEQGPRPVLSGLDISAGWPLLPGLVRVPFVGLGPAVFIAAQGSLLFAGLAALVDRLSGGPRFVAWTLTLGILALPVTWNYALFHSSDTLLLTATVWLLAAAAAPGRTTANGLRVLAWAGVVGATRFNGLTVTVALAAWVTYAWRRRPRGDRQLLAAAAATALLMPTGLHAWGRTGKTRNPAREGAAFRLWELRRSSPSEAVDAAFDAVGIPAHVRELPVDDACLDKGTWCHSVPVQKLAAVERSRPDVVRLYLREFLRQPLAWLAFNARVARSYLGISRPMPETEVGRTSGPNIAPSHAMRSPALRAQARAALLATQAAAGGLIARPLWLLLLVVITLALPGTPRRVAVPFGLFCASYLVPWVVITPAPDFRYAVCVTVPALLLALSAVAGFGRWMLLKRLAGRLDMGDRPTRV